MKASAVSLLFLAATAHAQVTTTGFNNAPRAEAPGTLLSHPITNGSEPIGRTTTINYLNGWIIVGAEVPGSRPNSDLQMRVYDIADPTNPVRRYPSDFGLSYANNSWIFGNHGWNAHGTAQYGNLLLPDPIRVHGFGGLVERAGTNGVPQLSQLPIWFNRSSQAGPWSATLLWYNTEDQDIQINKVFLNANGIGQLRPLATFDHVGAFGGGDWHPMFFGDLLIMARSGQAGNDGVVVYRLAYQNMEDADPANDAVTPQYVGSLQGGFQGYWPNLFSDGTGLYVIGSTTDILIGADITQATHPSSSGAVTLAASLTVPFFSNASYPVYQDNFGFIHNRKVDMTRFLAGEANPIVLTLNETNPPRQAGAPALPNGALVGVNTSQMSLPLGNLWLTGGYPIPTFNQGLGVWVHQQAADTAPPRVSFHIPQVNRTNYPRSAPLSFLIHEHPRSGGPRNGIDFLLRPVEVGNTLGTAVPGFLIHDFSGNMTFTPDAPLAASTTYQVDFPSDPGAQIGFRDAAGNYIEPYSYRFSTGSGVNATAPPSITSFSASNYQPAPSSSVAVTTTASGTGTLEYRFSFDGTWTAWSTSNSATSSYANTGRFRVLTQVRDSQGGMANASLNLLVITPPPASPRPTQSSTITVGTDPAGRRAWTVNPDANTVSVLDATTGAKLAEHAVGQNPRSIARDAQGRYWVPCFMSDQIFVLNPDGTPHNTLALDYGSGPFSACPSPDGSLMYVTLFSKARVLRYTTASPGTAPLSANTFPTPRAIAVSASGSRVFLSRFISPELTGEVVECSASLAFTRTISLAYANVLDGGDRAAGVPNYLTGLAISPDGTRLAVVSKHDNVRRGLLYGVGNLTHETTVRSVISFIDLAGTNAEIMHSRRDFDNSDSPSAVTYTPLGDSLLVALQGNNRVVGMDALNLAPVITNNNAGATETSPVVTRFELSTGLAPQGLAFDPTTNRLFVQDFMGRTVTVRDAQPLLAENRTTLPLLATTSSVANEALTAQVLLGKRIFYNAADERMSADSYISCATCHLDGGHDGRAWDFTGRNEGLRRTTDLRGRSGMGHGNVHWTGNFDEIQDFEHDIRGAFGGTGFLPHSVQQFATQHPSPATGKAGLSVELDALAAYVTSLGHATVPRSPNRAANGTHSAAATAGASLFTSEQCATCHSGNALSNSAMSPVFSTVMQNVGTHMMASGSRLGTTLNGLDTPTLHGVHTARNYLHHGLASTLPEVFSYGGGSIYYATSAQRITTANPAVIETFTETPAQGGGGFFVGAIGGTAVRINDEPGAPTQPSLRFNALDGGSGGGARLGIRYVSQYSGSSITLRINGAAQTVNLAIQSPNTGWQTIGWQWIYLPITLTAGTTNTLEIQRISNAPIINLIQVAHAGVLAQGSAHQRYASLTPTQQSNLLAYVREQDGRDTSGTSALADAPAPSPNAPTIVNHPPSQTLAEGNSLQLVVAHSGTGPFSYVWQHNGANVGTNSPELSITGVLPSHAGAYTVTVSNAQGSALSAAAQITVNGPLTITSTSLPAGTHSLAYQYTLSASGGVSTRTWSLASGMLPAGIALSSSGMLSGTAAAAGRADFTVLVSDTSGSDTQAISLTIAPINGPATDPDLILHYTFDEGSGTQVWDSAHASNNHSTTVSNAHWITDGRHGGAYGPSSTSGSLNDFTVANQSDLNFHPRGDAYTISIWARSTVAGGYNTVLDKGRGSAPHDSQYRMWMVNTGNSLQTISGGQFGSTMNVSSSPVNNGQWHLLTLVNYLDGSTWRTVFYYDAGAISNVTNAGTGGQLPGLLRIGDTTQGGNSWWGQLDDLRIYRRALTQPEIAALYTAPSAQTFTQWASSLPPGSNGTHHDANANGVVNLQEFLLGGSLAPLQLSLIGPEGSRQSRLTLTRNSLARGRSLFVECSTDLVTWSPLATSINGTNPTGPATITETTGVTRQMTVTHPQPPVRAFYRTRVE